MSEEVEGAGKEHKGRSRRRIVRLVRLAVAVGVGVFIVQKMKARSRPPEGLWREGISGNGLASSERR